MTYEVGTVYTIKLNSGEELIAKVIEITDTQLVITDPLSIAQGPKGMTLIPSMFTADPEKTIRLNTTSVTLYAHTEDNVKDQYITMTTGIQLPDKKIIMG
jgi:hypothetical protein